jgi:hypothetical protein
LANEKESKKMQGNYVLAFTVIFSFLMLLVQRTEARSRRKVFFGIVIITTFVLWNFVERRELQAEVALSVVLALVINFFFWVLIGRYNPVGSSDNIQVLGMDD